MSLIHQALKKVQETEKTHTPLLYNGGVNGRISYNLSLEKLRPIIIILSLIILISAGWWSISRTYFSEPNEATSKNPQSNSGLMNQSNNQGTQQNSAISTTLPALTDTRTADFENLLKEARIKNISGTELYKQKRFLLAKKEFLSSIEIFPKYAEAYNNLGLTYRQLGNPAAAEANYKKALQYKTDYPEAMNNYGILLGANGNSNLAREYFLRAILIAPDYPDPYLNMAISLEKGKKFEDAIAYYEGFLTHAKQIEDELLLRDVKEKLLYINANSILVEKNR